MGGGRAAERQESDGEETIEGGGEHLNTKWEEKAISVMAETFTPNIKGISVQK